ncbi:response regulator [Stackebrandtia nassauensis]|uniref:Two component transcriptional regulator, LuxR family n=1 Tax=Stackebrandtia nassauensis (strain DSM 44728 / CIP 108903 / NRRL B-16338 / NBRC 102104 / LLR-40K-21) TaxID=446470 RepID=D3Q6R2_STANL|nr:response regulator transcription factor [Stackebrandtia nassauensis]ADD44305.1 two component transcriptional regulator, LuxR family [Stackebrandtia nassauensis DSM 44728]
MTRVLLADDQPLIRAGFRVLLDAEDDIDVVGEASTGAEAVDLARETVPDIALVDVQMPEMDGIEATRRIAADPALSSVRVVILTNYALDEYIFDALRAGASGFLVKDTEPEELIRAVRTVAVGEALLAPNVTRRLIAEFAATPRVDGPAPLVSALTPREREVVTLVGQGKSNEEISRLLHISHTTAKTHVSRAMTKLGSRDRAQLVVAAYESGLVVPRASA